MSRIIRFCRTALTLFALAAQQTLAQRTMRPEDLFRIRHPGAIAWSPDGLYATIELTRPGRTLDASVPTNEIGLLDVKTQTLRTLSPNAPADLGYFNAVWSPDGRHLAFLSVDSSAAVRPWFWTIGAEAPTPLPDLDVRTGFGDPPLVWIGDHRIAVVAWDTGAEKSGDLYFRILRGRNIADGWKRAVDAQSPSVSVLESGNAAVPAAPAAQLVAIDLSTNGRATLARGSIHRLRVSADQRFLAFLRETPGIPGQPVASYFKHAVDPDAMYDAVNWGDEAHVIDTQSGAEIPASSMPPQPAKPAPRPDPTAPLPRPDARRLSASPAGDAALYIANAPDGSHLWLGGGAGRSMSAFKEVWIANQWMAEIKTGQAERIAYTGSDGSQLTAWLLLPPAYIQGAKLPMVTIVYPGSMYGASPPSSFSPYDTDFEHPQLFAALGYAVLRPSMPVPKDPAASHSLASLTSGVLPAVDAVIARGIADPDRVAVLGQSDGGFATLGIVTQTTRFRSAIASAASSDLVSLYGTFYGQYRNGDAGPPQKGQVLRMLQMEKGLFAFDGPPWKEPDRYRDTSALLHADQVQTPLMLIHGDLDFVPIQQAEEFFTALYRLDKRAMFVRYQGEWHTIANRANVLDLWQRLGLWLSETMAPRK